MIIFYIYVINHILDYLSTCLRNPQLVSCYEFVGDEVGITVEENKQLLHQEVVVLTGADQQLLHCGVLASLPGVGGGDAALAVQDAVVQHAS